MNNKLISILILSVIYLVTSDDTVCDLKPLGIKTAAVESDNTFKIQIEGAIDQKYIPGKIYTVRLFARDQKSSFIAFSISTKEDEAVNQNNIRRPIRLNPGVLQKSQDSTDTMNSPTCNNTVIQSNVIPKTSVEAIWTAPPKDNKCVTIRAMLAVKEDVWYNSDGPLSQTVCEDRRKMDDMPPVLNSFCQVCEDARYRVTFEGLWILNTHKTMYPKHPTLAKFSDIIGASHSTSFQLWKFNTEATQGLKLLAEYGNTTGLELEIQGNIGISVRTVIKATGLESPNTYATATFRVSRDMHSVSLLTSIIPSPDWFLGVANYELCDAKENKWVPTLRYNLYPMDAGTDSGKEFESSNESTSPPQPIAEADIIKSILPQDRKPFARLHFQLIRTYINPTCLVVAPNNEGRNEEGDEDTTSPPYVPRTPPRYVPNNPPREISTTEAPPAVDPESPDDCPLTEWDDWLECEGECIDGKISGYKTRMRYHIVDGVVVGKGNDNNDVEVSESCFYLHKDKTTETVECEDECETSTNNAQGSQISRKELFELWCVTEKMKRNKVIFEYVLEKLNITRADQELIRLIQNRMSAFSSFIETKWKSVAKDKNRFEVKYCEWLEGFVKIPTSLADKENLDSEFEQESSTRAGRPEKSFDSCSEHSKRAKVRHLVDNVSVNELTYAAQMATRASGSRISADIIKSVSESPESGKNLLTTKQKFDTCTLLQYSISVIS